MQTLNDSDDPFDLNRFVLAQAEDYATALAEIRAGRKQSHWMWYIFPQFAGLGFSAMSKQYAIRSADEARAYLAHPLLGPRLVRCCVALLEIDGRSENEIFGSPDDVKLRSSMTLFSHVSPAGSVFAKVLEKYFEGTGDAKTLELLGVANRTVLAAVGDGTMALKIIRDITSLLRNGVLKRRHATACALVNVDSVAEKDFQNGEQGGVGQKFHPRS